MRTALIWPVTCLVLLSAPSVLAQSAPASLRGRVLAADNDRALPRARVALVADGRSNEAVFTDDRGRFEVSTVVSGFSRTTSEAERILAVTKAGYGVQHITVPAGARQELTIRLARSVAISGRVADPNGEGAVDVRIVARRQDVAAGDSTPARFETTSDDLGEYRLGGLPAGRYEVGMEGQAEPSTLELRGGDEIASINFSRLVNESVSIGPGAATTEPVPGQEGTSTISGRVLSASGRPVASARVRALRTGLTPRGAATDSQGRFTIARLPAGAYVVDAGRNGFVTVQYGQERTSQPRKQVSVRDGETASDIQIILPRGTAVTGTIVDEHGEPLQGINVRAMQLRYGNGRAAAMHVGPRDLRTDDRGRYRIHGLLPGSYLIVASAEVPISGARSRGYAPVFYPGTTQAGEASPVVADLGRDVPAIDLVLTQTPAVRVTAIVRTSDGAPFTGLVLMLASQRSGGIAVEPQRPAETVDGSRFVFTNVPPGDYVVQAMRAREQNRGMFEFGAQLVAVVDREPAPLVVTTSPGATWTGRTVYEGDGTRRGMEQASSVMPFPVDFDRAPAIGGGTYSASIRADGSFSMSGLFGPTRFRLMGREDSSYLKSITIGGLDITDTPFDFGTGTQTITGAEVVISNAGAAISGHVTDAAASPVSSYSVVVFPTDRTKWFVTSRFLKLARPTQDGSFEVNGLPPGEYFLAATDPVEGNDVSGDWLKPETLEQLSFRATRVTLAEKQHVMTVLRLIRR
jgi:hypothetical protein